MLSFLFYRSPVAVVLLLPLIWFVPHRMKTVIGEAKREELASQFRDGALSLAASLEAGYSVENAWQEAAAQMREIYGETSVIHLEFAAIARKLKLGVTSEEAVKNLAQRSAVPEILQFSEVFAAAKRTSGSLAPILKNTAQILAGKIRIREEIRTMSAARQLEMNIMSLMPVLILLYVNLGSPGYTDPLYETLAGRVVMTAALGIYAAAIMLGRKILRIEI